MTHGGAVGGSGLLRGGESYPLHREFTPSPVVVTQFVHGTPPTAQGFPNQQLILNSRSLKYRCFLWCWASLTESQPRQKGPRLRFPKR
jgi:hypothetical protein